MGFELDFSAASIKVHVANSARKYSEMHAIIREYTWSNIQFNI